MLATMAVIQDGGLTVRKVIGNIPHDPAAFFVYGLLLLFVAFIVAGSRKKPS